MLLAFSSPVKFSKIVFPVWNFVHSLTEVALQKRFLSVVANHSKSDYFTLNWEAESDKIRKVYSTEFLLNAETIRLNSSAIDFFLLKSLRWETQN